jgi:EAL domain-containing protein (putative c-di-GMP-specific phosphodiesterase class I)
MAAARTPLNIEGIAHKLSITCGYVQLQDGANAGVDLLKDASIALKRAKKDHKGHYVTFSAHLGAEARTRALMLAELRAAFEAERLFLVYQPQIDLATGELIGLEALIRWRTEAGQFVPPDQFIPVAERSGLMAPLGQWVMTSACMMMRDLLDMGVAPQRIAVNVSVVQLQDVAFADHVNQALALSGLQGHHLELEITESVAVLPTAYLETTLAGLRARGISIAIDDFGTGYSSLKYLQRFSVDKLKIDQSFVRGLGMRGQDDAIVSTIIGLADNLGLKTIAEGVETPEELARLRHMGCAEIQGYLTGRPVDSATFAAVLRAGCSAVIAELESASLEPSPSPE